MPDDVAGAAKKRLAAGEARAALSLLYRGALSHLIYQMGQSPPVQKAQGSPCLLYRGALSHLIYQSFLEIPASATEGACLALVRKNRPGEEFLFFRELTQVWLEMAYGHIRPDTGQVASLCRKWSDYFA